MLWTATTSLLPLIVLAIAGAKQSAYFFLSWTIAYTLYLLSRNLGMSLVTEGARAPQRLYEFALRTLAQSGKIVVPLALVVALASPLILRVLGPGYVDGRGVAAPAARAVGDPQRRDRDVPQRGTRPTSHARGRGRDRGDVGLVMGLSVVLLDRYGLTGVGVAWLVAQSIVALALLATELRALWLPRVPLHRLPRPRLGHKHTAAPAAPALAAARGTGTPIGPVHSDDDLGAVTVRRRGSDETAVLRYARGALGARSLAHHEHALEMLAAESKLDEWRALAPRIRTRGAVSGQPWLIETHIPGSDARHAVPLVGADVVTARAGAAIRGLHVATAAEATVDEAVLAAWVDDPIDELRVTAGSPLRASADHAALDRVQASLREELAGRILTTCFVHGDYWLGNVLDRRRRDRHGHRRLGASRTTGPRRGRRDDARAHGTGRATPTRVRPDRP